MLTLHTGYAELKSKMSLGAFKTLIREPSAHVETRRGTQQQAIDYCTKNETRHPSLLSCTTGVKKSQGKRTDLLDLAESVLNGATMGNLLEDGKSAEMVIKYSKGIQFLMSRIQKKNVLAWRELKVYLICGPTGIGKTRFNIFILILINADGCMIDTPLIRYTSSSRISLSGLIIMREKTSY